MQNRRNVLYSGVRFYFGKWNNSLGSFFEFTLGIGLFSSNNLISQNTVVITKDINDFDIYVRMVDY